MSLQPRHIKKRNLPTEASKETIELHFPHLFAGVTTSSHLFCNRMSKKFVYKYCERGR